MLVSQPLDVNVGGCMWMCAHVSVCVRVGVCPCYCLCVHCRAKAVTVKAIPRLCAAVCARIGTEILRAASPPRFAVDAALSNMLRDVCCGFEPWLR